MHWNVAAIVAVCVVIVVLVMVLAMALARRAATGADGGAEDDRVPVDAVMGGHEPHHELGRAMHRYALGLGDKDIVGVHPPSSLREWAVAPAVTGGSRRREVSSPHKWDDVETWAALAKDKEVEAQYMRARARALNNLKFDWTHVLAAVEPHLGEDREYIGLISAAPGGALQVISSEASPTPISNREGSNATVPLELIEKVSERPALFIWHTHPADPRGSPLPSPADISTAITMGYAGLYAANLVISRYGVILYTLGWPAYQRIHGSENPELAMCHLRYDAAAHFSTIRSWGTWSLDDYRKAFERFGLTFVVYPSPEYVAADHLTRFRSDLSTPSDFELLDDLRKEIGKHSHKRRAAPKD